MKESPVADPHAAASKLVSHVKGWKGRQFQTGQRERCAAFVRQMFKDVGIPIPVVTKPTDFNLLPPGSGVGENHADSFAGDTVGPKVNVEHVRPGDIVMYQNTYGNYRRGVITHVAIYVGDGTIIHRPTAAKPVINERLNYATVAEIRRPKQFVIAATGGLSGSSVKIFKHDGKVSAIKDGHTVTTLELRMSFNGRLTVMVNGHSVDPAVVELQMFM
jgi:NlpC/P60 family